MAQIEGFKINYAAHTEDPLAFHGDFIHNDYYKIAIPGLSGMALEALPTQANKPNYFNAFFSTDIFNPGKIYLPRRSGAIVATCREGVTVGIPSFAKDKAELDDLLFVSYLANSDHERVMVCIAVSKLPFALAWKLRNGDLVQIGLSSGGKLVDATSKVSALQS